MPTDFLDEQNMVAFFEEQDPAHFPMLQQQRSCTNVIANDKDAEHTSKNKAYKIVSNNKILNESTVIQVAN